jgi:ribosomal protein L37AE/L43A
MIRKLERKFGKYAIHDLMKYVTILYILGFFVYIIGQARGVDFYSAYLSFNVDAILSGQIWRIVTWLIQPLDSSLLFMVIAVYLYYMIGTNLERVWGSFRFNLFYISGVIFNIIAAVLIYIIFYVISGGALHANYPITLEYINLSMFFAFAAIYSDVELLLFFVLPIKVKYIAWAYAAIEIFGVAETFFDGYVLLGSCQLIVLVVSLLNFIIFWLDARKYRGGGRVNRRRQREFARRYEEGVNASYQESVRRNQTGRKETVITRHKCAVCGRTELDGDDLEFRFCSKCDGNYEYCNEHLYTHTHVVREYTNNQ